MLCACANPQLAPFPHDRVAEAMEQFPNATEVMWSQEEPQNMGAWSYVAPRLVTAATTVGKDVKPVYVGREPSAAPAAGLKKVHELEQAALVEKTLAL